MSPIGEGGCSNATCAVALTRGCPGTAPEVAYLELRHIQLAEKREHWNFQRLEQAVDSMCGG
jgi:hypothetical protein